MFVVGSIAKESSHSCVQRSIWAPMARNFEEASVCGLRRLRQRIRFLSLPSPRVLELTRLDFSVLFFLALHPIQWQTVLVLEGGHQS